MTTSTELVMDRLITMSLAGLMIAAATPAIAADDPAVCTALLDPTKIAATKSVADRYTYSQLIQSADNNTSSFGLGVVLPINGLPVGANLNQANSDAQSRLANVGINYSHDEQLGYAMSYLPRYAGDRFVECIDKLAAEDDGGISVLVKSAASDGAVVTIKVHPTKSREFFRRKLLVSTTGVTEDKIPRKFDDKGGSIDLVIRRPNLSKDIIVRAEIDTFGGQPTSQTITIPWQPIEFDTEETATPVPVRCGQNNYGRWYSQTQAVVTAKPGEFLFPDTVQRDLGSGIPASPDGLHGDQPFKFPNGVTDPSMRGFEIQFSSPFSIGGNAWCQIAATENPGWNGTFSVKGKTVSRPPNVGPAMTDMIALKYR